METVSYTPNGAQEFKSGFSDSPKPWGIEDRGPESTDPDDLFHIGHRAEIVRSIAEESLGNRE